MDGLSLDEFCKNATQTARDNCARSIIKMTLASAEFGCFNSDFNPGNFLFKNDGTLVCLDFGSTILWDKKMQDNWKQSIEAFLTKNPKLFQTTLRQTSNPTKKLKDAETIFQSVTGNGKAPWWNYEENEISQESFRDCITHFIRTMLKPLDGVRVEPTYLWGFRLYYGHVALNSLIKAKINWGQTLTNALK